jgi:Uma2 family endonuclease
MPQNQPRIEVAPELMIEVLSPADTASEWLEKLRDYHQIGVQKVWAVDPQSASVEVLRWSEAGWQSVGVFTGDQPIRSHGSRNALLGSLVGRHASKKLPP